MKKDLIINGTGDYPGGNYHKISIRGEGTILDDVECLVFNVYGTSEVLKSVKAGSVKILGEAETKGRMEVNDMLVMGSMGIGENAHLNKVKVMGTLDIAGELSGETATILGSISVGGDAEFETFSSSGGFEIKGLLNADTINIGLRFAESSADEIGGGKITVKKKRNSLLPFKGSEGSLRAKVIEGDEVSLENTKADVVRGNKVKIGQGCEIGLVEYRSELSEDKNARIKVAKKI